MHEKRLTQRLTGYWDRLRKEDAMPPFQKFNPSALDDVWDNCMLIAVNDSAPSPSYAYYQLGDKLRGLYGSDVAGQTMRPAVKTSQTASIVKRVGELVEKRTPVYDDGQFVGPRNKIVKFRSCMLPFGQENRVTHIIVGLSWREFG